VANKIHTLRRRQDFDLLKKNGKKVYPNNWLILNYLENTENINRFGWTIPNKVGGSVLRNRIKRWCREYFRAQTLHPTKYYDVNVIIRASSDANYFRKIKFQDFKEELDSVIKKLR
jgi:ribonuclease P protein component